MRPLSCVLLTLSLATAVVPASAQPVFPQLMESARASSEIVPAAMQQPVMRREARTQRRHRCDGTHNGNCRLFRHNF